MSGFISIAKWEHYQHYKDRNPPWIKLHQEILTSVTWATGDDASRALMVAIMLLASRTGNRIPADPLYIQRVGYLNASPDFTHLLRSGFIELKDGASESLASCKQDARPETEEETETDQRKTPPAPRKRGEVEEPESFQRFWAAYPKKLAKQNALRAWLKAGVVNGLEEKIMSALDAQKRSACWTKNGGEFIPYPASWINGKRWLDEVVTNVPQAVEWSP